MKVKFIVPGQPQGKGRPRFSNVCGHVQTRTPDQTVVYENLIRLQYQQQVRGYTFPDKIPLDVRILAFYQIPASVSKKKREAMLAGEIRPVTKPDWDNVGKVVCDSLNTIAYKDDSHIADAQVRKFYSDRPRLEVIIQTAGGVPNE